MDIYEKKLKALDYFKDRLLSSDAKEQIGLKMEDIPRTHGGVVQKFGELYVKPAIVPEDAGRLLNIALENKNKVRYDYHAKITKEDVEDVERLTTTLTEVLEREMESF